MNIIERLELTLDKIDATFWFRIYEVSYHRNTVRVTIKNHIKCYIEEANTDNTWWNLYHEGRFLCQIESLNDGLRLLQALIRRTRETVAA